MTEQRRAGGPVEWFSLTIDCHDADALAEFSAKPLGREITYRTADQAWVRAPGIALVCRAVVAHKPTTWPSSEVPLHSHFEFVVADPDETAEEMRQREQRSRNTRTRTTQIWWSCSTSLGTRYASSAAAPLTTLIRLMPRSCRHRSVAEMSAGPGYG